MAIQKSSTCNPSYLPRCTLALLVQVSQQMQLQTSLLHRPLSQGGLSKAWMVTKQSVTLKRYHRLKMPVLKWCVACFA